MADESEPRDKNQRPAQSGPRRHQGKDAPRRDDRGGEQRRRTPQGEWRGGERRDGDRKPFERRSADGAGRPRRDDRGGEKRDGDRKPFERRSADGAGRPRRDERGGEKRDGDRKPFERRPTEGAGRPRRDSAGGPRRDGDRFSRAGSSAGSGAGSGARRNGPDRGDRTGRGDRSGYSDRPDRTGRTERPERPVREAPERNPSDLRSANRSDRGRSPDIDEDVTGAELDRVTTAQVNNLDEHNATWVARHLVMAARLIDDDPELAFQHTLAASRRGGRLAIVRETVGIAAYQAGHYAEALRELRTHRRISGSQVHLPLIADAERGNGKPEKALEIAHSAEVGELDTAGKVEMSMVESGARADLGQFDAAVSALETRYLVKDKAFSYSPRLFSAYADALAAAGRAEEAESWYFQARRAEEALGVGDFAEPEIIDLVPDLDKPERTKKFDRERKPRAQRPMGEAADTVSEKAPESTDAAKDTPED